MRIGLAQLNSRQNKQRNLEIADESIAKLAGEGADLVMLPEVASFHGLDAAYAEHAEPDPGPFTDWCREQARRHGIYLHCGSFAERRVEAAGECVYNTSIVFDRDAEEVARYSKIHLFDAVLADGLDYRESAAFTPGNEVVVCECDGIRFGLAICYDIRFPEMFNALADMGAQVMLLPAAFTVPTGISHWEPCLRARAIETGCYVAGCGQWGLYARGRANYGHSMVVDPWGTMISQCREGIDTITADIDLEYLELARRRMPVQRHRRRDLFG